LPVLDDFAAWMSSPPGQKQLQEIANAARDVLTNLAATAKWAIANKDWLVPLVAGVAALSAAAKTVAGITVAIQAANAAMAVFNATTLLNPLVLAGAQALAILSIPGSAPVTGTRPAPIPQTPNSPMRTPVPSAPSSGFNFGTGTIVNNNVTINTPKVDAREIVNTLNNAQKTGYTGTLRSLKE